MGWIQPDFLLVEKEGGVFFHCQMAVLEIRSPMEDGECSKEEKSIRLCKKKTLHFIQPLTSAVISKCVGVS